MRVPTLIFVLLAAHLGRADCPPWFSMAPGSSGSLDAVRHPRVGDFNADGILDLADGNRLLFGRGDGTFRPPEAATPNGNGPFIGDFNNDGRPDLALSGGNAGLCGAPGRAYLSNGPGSFVEGPFFHGLGLDFDLSRFLDLDRDGNLDLVTANGFPSSCSVSTWLGDGRGGFTGFRPVYSEPADPSQSLLAGDVDGDGIVDLLVRTTTTTGLKRIVVLHGHGDATFAPAGTLEYKGLAQSGPMALGDLNDDGRPDVLVLADRSVIVFLQRANGLFEPVTTQTGFPFVYDVVVADFTGDGLPDVALRTVEQVNGKFLPFLEVLAGDGRGGFRSRVQFELPGNFYAWLVAGDFNGDGKTDLATGSQGAGFTVLLNSCRGGERLVAVLPTVVSSSGAHDAHFRTDLILKNPGSTAVEGRLVFHPGSRRGGDGDPSLPFALGSGETRRIEDLVAAIGEHGRGSLDVLVTRGSAPLVHAEIVNDGPTSSGMAAVEPGVAPGRFLTLGKHVVLAAPGEPSTTRMAIGFRTFDDLTSLSITVRDRDGKAAGAVYKDLAPYLSIQWSAEEILGGVALPAGGSVRVSILSGAAIVYATLADNATSAPVLQLSRP